MVVPRLYLHCQNGQLVCDYSWHSWQPAVLWRRTDVFPVAASSGRLVLHGHVSTTNASVDSGGGGREGCGLFYLISVSTRASVWCKRVGVFFPPFSTLALFSFSLSQICAAPSSYLSHSVLSAGPSLPTLFKSCALTIKQKTMGYGIGYNNWSLTVTQWHRISTS